MKQAKIGSSWHILEREITRCVLGRCMISLFREDVINIYLFLSRNKELDGSKYSSLI